MYINYLLINIHLKYNVPDIFFLKYITKKSNRKYLTVRNPIDIKYRLSHKYFLKKNKEKRFNKLKIHKIIYKKKDLSYKYKN